MKTKVVGSLLMMLGVLTGQVQAQTWPERAVRVVVPFSAGGGTDIIARLVAQRLSERLGQPFVVENRTGGNGNIGAQLVARAGVDGHTLLVSTSALTINPALHDNTGYQLKEFTPVTQLATSPYLLVVNPVAAPGLTSLASLIEQAKSREGAVSWASTSEGNAEHLAGALLQQMAGFRMTHVPYKGGADALKDVVGGHVAVGVVSLPTSIAFVKSGQLRVLGVTSATRAPQIPDIPTLSEIGVSGYELPTWYGMWAPAGVRPDIVARLNVVLADILRNEEVSQRVIGMGFAVGSMTQAQFGDYVQREAAKYIALAAQIGLKKQ